MNYAIIDLYNLFHRTKHISATDIETKAGMALHISLMSLRKICRSFNIDHIVAVTEGGSWRRTLYPQYKAHRRVAESLLSKREQQDNEYYFGVMREFMDFLRDKTNITFLQEKGIEGDDFVARWIQKHPNDNHVILSGDTDFYQLIAPNVKIYDGVKDITISHTAVLDEKGRPAVKRKNIVENINGKKVKKVQETVIQPPNPEYELFKKIIRGDAGDNVPPSYPGAREFGSLKKPGIKQAFDDREHRGIDWNMFMLVEWDKLVGEDEYEQPIFKKVRVLDEYNTNRVLIDLSLQPDYIKEKMDAVILRETTKDCKKNLGINFLKFCAKHNLPNISKDPEEFASILGKGYK